MTENTFSAAIATVFYVAVMTTGSCSMPDLNSALDIDSRKRYDYEAEPHVTNVSRAWVEPVESHTLKSKTALGAKLRALRQKILDSGVPLLSLEELEEEIKSRRGTEA